VFPHKVTPCERMFISTELQLDELDELEEGMLKLKSYKPLGLVGLPFKFYKKMWHVAIMIDLKML